MSSKDKDAASFCKYFSVMAGFIYKKLYISELLSNSFFSVCLSTVAFCVDLYIGGRIPSQLIDLRSRSKC